MDRRPPPRVGRRAGRLPPRAAGEGRGPERGRAGRARATSSRGWPRREAIQGLLADRVRQASASRGGALDRPPGDGPGRPEEASRARGSAALADVLAGDDAELSARPRRRRVPCRSPKEGAEGLREALLRVGRSATAPDDVRLEALAAVPGGLAEVAPELFAFLLERLGPDRPVATRVLAADVLARATLGRDQLARPGRRGAGRRAAGGQPPAGGLRAVDRRRGRPQARRRPEGGGGPVEPAGRRAQEAPREVRPRGRTPRPSRCTRRSTPTRRSRRPSWRSCWPRSSPATSAAARRSSTAPRRPAPPATPSATSAARSAPT